MHRQTTADYQGKSNAPTRAAEQASQPFPPTLDGGVEITFL
jgi:hypothetical protein